MFATNGTCRVVGSTLIPGDAGSLCQLTATRLGDANYLPADPATPPTEPRLLPEIGKYRAQYFTPEEIQDNMPKWAGIFRELFR